MRSEQRAGWNPERVRRLRRTLHLTQRGFAQQLGVRQQTVSEWETGVYMPRGASARLLDIVAERAGLAYDVASAPPASEPTEEGRTR